MPSESARVLVSIVEVDDWLDEEKHIGCLDFMMMSVKDLTFLDGVYVGNVLLYDPVFLLLHFLRSLLVGLTMIYFAQFIGVFDG